MKFSLRMLIKSIFTFITTVAALLAIVLACVQGYSKIVFCFMVSGATVAVIYFLLRGLFQTLGWLTKISEREFVNNIDFNKVKRLSILGHTGKRIYLEPYAKLEDLAAEHGQFPEEIRVLTRVPLVEGLSRNQLIIDTIHKVRRLREKGANVGIRFYEALPSIRGIICEFRNGERKSYISMYNWQQGNKSHAFDHAIVQRDSITREKPMVKMLNSWISHYWGKDEIHTVAFDFDDTLAFTGDIQIRAWIQAIEQALSCKLISENNVSGELLSSLDKYNESYAIIKKVWLEKHLAEEIVLDLLPGIDKKLAEEINHRRFAIRESLMDQVIPFEGVHNTIKSLSQRHNLAIISSTEQQMIKRFLSKRMLADYFPIILGKSDPKLRQQWEHISSKANLLIKLSELVGIPLDRIVFIGNDDSDYLAAHQLGINFIETREAAKRMNKESLITKIDPSKTPVGYFDSFKDKRLEALLAELSKCKQNNKYKE